MRYFVTAVYLILFSILFALWFDQAQAQSYFKGPALIQTPTIVVTSGGTTTLTKDSNTVQVFTGASAQTVRLPDAESIPIGRRFEISNKSGAAISVQDFGNNVIVSLYPAYKTTVVLQSNSDSNGVWVTSYSFADTGAMSQGDIPFADAAGVLTSNIDVLNYDSSSSYITAGVSQIRAIKNTSGTNVQLVAQNNSNTANANSVLLLGVGGTSAGDPQVYFSVSGGSSWKAGVDNSDSDKLKICQTTSDIGTNCFFDMTTAGALTLAGYGAGILHSSSGGAITSSAVSLTADVSGVLPIANGGTNNGSLGVTNGGVIYADGSKLANTGAGSSGQVLVSAGASAPVWTTSTIPSTATAPCTLVANSNNTITCLAATTSNRVLLTTNGTSLSMGQVDLTSQVTGTLPIANGGTNKALTLSAGGIPYFDSDSFEVLSAGTIGKPIVSGGSGAPSFSTLGISGGGTNNASLDTTLGNLVYTDGSKMSTVSIGSTGQVLTVSGGTPLWQSWGGTWTPTVTNGTNMAASTTRQGTYLRSGASVHACFAPDLDPTSTGAADFYFSIPVASNFTSDLIDATGLCDWNGGASNGVCHCNGDSTNDRMYCSMSAASTSNATAWVCVQYVVK